MEIKWEYISQINCHEGFINNKRIFSVDGTLCVIDLRPTSETPWRSPDYYRISSVEEGKEIAFDLLNNLNVEKHKKNKEAWIAEQQKTVDLIRETDEFIKSLKSK